MGGYSGPPESTPNPLNNGSVRSRCLMILDRKAIRHFEMWGCTVNIVRLFYPNPAFMKSHALYLGFNDLYEQNPYLREADVSKDLDRILQCPIDAGVIKREDITEITVYFKSSQWFGFINFSEALDENRVAFVFTWLKENTFHLPSIHENQRIFVKYARKEDSPIPPRRHSIM